MTTFTVDDAFPLARVNLDDRRFMSRLTSEAWEPQVQALMVEIEQQGLLHPWASPDWQASSAMWSSMGSPAAPQCPGSAGQPFAPMCMRTLTKPMPAC